MLRLFLYQAGLNYDRCVRAEVGFHCEISSRNIIFSCEFVSTIQSGLASRSIVIGVNIKYNNNHTLCKTQC